MSEHYDALETRDPLVRENVLFRRLPGAVAHAMRAPPWARHLAGVEPRPIASRGALAPPPVLRKPALVRLQKEDPPFGGFAVTPPGQAKRLFMSPGPLF